MVELLIVIAVMGVLAGAVLVSINPADKIAQANDAKVQSDISQVATGVATYVAEKGYYPVNTAAFAGAGLQIESYPAAPSGYTAYSYVPAPAACTGVTCTSAVVTGQLKAAKFTATPFQRWESPSGKVCQVLTATTSCP